MRRRNRALVLALLLTFLLAACSGRGGGVDFALDGSPRIPDDEGIVTAVDHETLTLDGERRYDVHRDLASFSALDLSTVPLLFTQGQYVQVGTNGDTVVWLGALAKPLATDPPAVLYTGEVEAVTASTVQFVNGTVLQVDPAVDLSSRVGDDVRVLLDPRTKKLTEVLA